MNLQSEQIDKIVPALIKARGNFAAAVKDGANPHFKSKYVTLDGVVAAVNGALLESGIFQTQPTEVTDTGTILHTRFLHTSGQWIGSAYPVHPVKNDPQGEGSALTYARRYALMALAGIAPEDDDGNAATSAATRDNDREAEDVRSWIDAITACADSHGLDALAREIAVSGLSASSKLKLRSAFSAQRNALTNSKGAVA